jgi:chromosome segregation ATPase
MNKQIDAKVDELGAKSINDALAWSTKKEPKWQEAITKAEGEKATAQGNLNEALATIKKYKDVKASELTASQELEYKNAVADKKQLEEKLAAGEYDKAIEKAKAAEKERQNQIDNIIEKLKDLLKDKENAENQIKQQQEEQILDKADGNRFQRSSLEDVNKLFDKNGNIIDFIETKKSKTTKADGDKSQEISLEKVKVTRADVRYAILAYRKSTDDDEKKEWADKFAKLLDKLPHEDRSSDILAAKKIILG